MAFQIAQCSFDGLSSSYLIKYAGEADARDKQKVQSKTMQIKVLDGLASLAADNYKEAAYRLSNISVSDSEALL